MQAFIPEKIMALSLNQKKLKDVETFIDCTFLSFTFHFNPSPYLLVFVLLRYDKKIKIEFLPRPRIAGYCYF